VKVLIVHDEPIDSGYGAEAYVRRLVAGLDAAGDQVELMAGEHRHHGLTKLLDPWDPTAWRLLTERALRFRPDVIHHHNIARELSASVLTAAPTIPAVMTVHDQRMVGGREHSARSIRGVAESIGSAVLLRTACRHLAATIAVSERLATLLQAAGLPDVTTIPVPISDPIGPARPAEACRDVAVIGRLAPDKGVDLVIDAFALLGDAIRTSRLVIAGDGPSRAALERRAAPLGNQVRFLGRLDEREVSALLGQVRLVVVASMPSRRPEGSSLTAAEAAGHGRAVLGSSDPAVVEVIDRTGAGETVPAGDAPALAAALRRYLTDDGLVAAAAARASTGTAAYSIAAVTAATREVYRRVIDAGSAGAGQTGRTDG
jgi:glycosyltransferase involved in cell wall biosynthesis